MSAIAEWNETWTLAVVFGIASVPWTDAFVVLDVPLWPSFEAAVTYYAIGRGVDGFVLRLEAGAMLVGAAIGLGIDRVQTALAPGSGPVA